MKISRIPTMYPLLFVIVQFLAGACSTNTKERFEFTQIHMAMPVRIVMYSPDTSTARSAAKAAFQRIAALEAMMSDFRPQSELRRLEERPDEWVIISPELFEVLSLALELSRLTNGAFDPTSGPFVALWREARNSGRLPEPSRLDSARRLVGIERVSLDSITVSARLRPGTRLDLGGIAKGFILHDALLELSRHGVGSALIEAGGDIVASNSPPGLVGWTIELPGASDAMAITAKNFSNSSLATSGPASQSVTINGITYSHVVDPRTGEAVTTNFMARVIAASVDAAMVDALATALTVLSEQEREQVLRGFPGILTEVVPSTDQMGSPAVRD